MPVAGEELHRARNYPVAGASGAQYHPRRGEELGHWPGEDVCQWPKRPPSRAPVAPESGRYPSDSSPRPPDVCRLPGEELHRARNYPVAGASGAQYHPRRGEELGHWPGEDVCQWPKRPPSRAPVAPAFGRYPSDSSPRPPDVCRLPGEELHRARNYPVAGASGAQYHPRRGEDLGHWPGEDVCQWPKRPPSRAPEAPESGRYPSDSSPRPPDVCHWPGEELHRARNYPVAGASGAQYHPRRGEDLGHWPGEDVCQWPKRPPSRAPVAPAFGRNPSDSSPRPPDVCRLPARNCTGRGTIRLRALQGRNTILAAARI